jgi:hypothetical protein
LGLGTRTSENESRKSQAGGLDRCGNKWTVQEKAGGPRGGSGELVSHAMWADGVGRKAWAKLLASSKLSDSCDAGALIWAHKGHAMSLDATRVSVASSPTSFMPPMAEQTICEVWGWTKGEATATPMNNTNHTSTKRVRRWALRRAWRDNMAGIMSLKREAPATQWALTPVSSG